MKKELLIGILGAGYLAVSIGAQSIIANHQTKDLESFQLKAINEQTAEYTRLNATMKENAIAQKQATSIKTVDPTGETPFINASPDGTRISQDFKITEIDNQGNVRGEPAEGPGEGIYYPMQTFKDNGAGVVKVGDVVEVTWSTEAYMSQEWNNVKSISKIN